MIDERFRVEEDKREEFDLASSRMTANLSISPPSPTTPAPQLMAEKSSREGNETVKEPKASEEKKLFRKVYILAFLCEVLVTPVI